MKPTCTTHWCRTPPKAELSEDQRVIQALKAQITELGGQLAKAEARNQQLTAELESQAQVNSNLGWTLDIPNINCSPPAPCLLPPPPPPTLNAQGRQWSS